MNNDIISLAERVRRHANPCCPFCDGSGRRRYYGFREVTDRLLCMMCNGFGFLPSEAQRDRAAASLRARALSTVSRGEVIE